jgi:trimeric autotransporter adhesin
VKAVQELSKKTEEVDELKKQVAELKQMVMDLKNGNTNSSTTSSHSPAYLEQCTPNPSYGPTIIRYHLPSKTTSAKVVIMDMKGAVIESIALNTSGDGQLAFNSSSLAAGTYAYSLWVGGRQVDSKQMMVGR